MNHLYKILELFIYLEEIDISGTYDPKYNFCAILCILLDGHLVQFRIKFDNHVEIHLTYRKKQISFKNFETSARHLICSVLHAKNILVYVNNNFYMLLHNGAIQ